jgi:hypothetical protein
LVETRDTVPLTEIETAGDGAAVVVVGVVVVVVVVVVVGVVVVGVPGGTTPWPGVLAPPPGVAVAPLPGKPGSVGSVIELGSVGSDVPDVGTSAPALFAADGASADGTGESVTCGVNGFFVWNTSNVTSWFVEEASGTSVSARSPLAAAGVVVVTAPVATFGSAVPPTGAVGAGAAAAAAGFLGCMSASVFGISYAPMAIKRTPPTATRILERFARFLAAS